jgi:ABC-2 type transport system ATP-binding protein
MNAIELRDITKSFSGHLAVDNLSLTVPQGSIYGFLGPNGSGKTTTIRMIMNILLPDKGEITVLGVKTSKSARQKVSYLPEERGLYKKMEVGRLLHYFGSLQGMTDAQIKEAAGRWLTRLELEKWVDKKTEALSKGMSQKIQFIASVIADPELLILDEPFSGLDPVNAEVLQEAILEQKRRGTTIVFSTHDMSKAERLCDRIFMIFQGRKVLDGSLEEIQSSYGLDTIRVRTSVGKAGLEGMEQIETINDLGNLQELRLKPDQDTQAFLQALAARSLVSHFEIAHPSLHDIFVRIARPERVGQVSENRGG